MVYCHLAVVFLLTGLWHGASWNFILWGVWHGFFILLERKFQLSKSVSGKGIFGNVYVMLIVIVGWVMFRIENMGLLFAYLKTMFGCYKADWVRYQIGYFADKRSIFVLVIAFAFSYGICEVCKRKVLRKLPVKVRQIGENTLSIVLLLLCIIVLTNSTYNPFIYFRF